MRVHARRRPHHPRVATGGVDVGRGLRHVAPDRDHPRHPRIRGGCDLLGRADGVEVEVAVVVGPAGHGAPGQAFRRGKIGSPLATGRPPG